MGYTMKQINDCLKRLSRLKSAKGKINSSYEHKAKDAVRLMAPRLIEMKKDGFSIHQLAEELAKDGIIIPAPTLGRYLSAYQKAQPSGQQSESLQPVLQSASIGTQEKSAADNVDNNAVAEKESKASASINDKVVPSQGQ